MAVLNVGCGNWTRTSDLQVMSLTSYQLLYPASIKLVGVAGFEPATPTPPEWCATKLRYTPYIFFFISAVL
tara:strand:- start:233 stop:445 length:213 start_codon:yes stop_codon:yes gene_type:complete